jgi:predicted nucleic acid-binding protein
MGQMTIQGKRKGVTISTADGLIAATAIEHGLTLATRNVKDFGGIEVLIFNPWED